MDGLNIRHQAVTPAIMYKIVQKLNLRDQVYLSMTSRYGRDAIEAHGIPLAFIDCTAEASKSVWLKRLEPEGNALLSCWALMQKCYDQLIKINGKDSVDFENETRHRIHRGGVKFQAEKRILALLRVPRPSDIQSLEFEFEVRPVRPAFGWEQYAVCIGFIMAGPLTDPKTNCPFEEKYHVVVEVMPDRPADRAGLRLGDRVYKINDQELSLDTAETLKLMACAPRMRVAVKRIKQLEFYM